MPPLVALLGLQGLSAWAKFSASAVGIASLLASLYAANRALELVISTAPVILQRAFVISGLQTALAMIAGSIVAGFGVAGTKNVLSIAARLGGFRK